jgi:hypothetical protein
LQTKGQLNIWASGVFPGGRPNMSIEKVKDLGLFVLEDGVPNIETAPLAISYELSSFANPVNYADAKGFDADFQDETAAIAEMDNLLENGKFYVHLLYCFRSCSRALPMVTDQNQADKVQIHTKTFQVLRPEISKLKHLMDYHETVIKVLSNLTHTSTSHHQPSLLHPSTSPSSRCSLPMFRSWSPQTESRNLFLANCTRR